MKKSLFSWMGLLVAVLLVTRCQQNQKTAVATENGARLFIQYCSTCHQGNGIGGPAPGGGVNAVDIRQFTKNKQELIDIITHGYGQMPAFGDSTSKENISLIATYVETEIEKHAAANTAATGAFKQ